MSHGQHRAPKPKTRRLRRLAAILSMAAAAATIGFLADDVVATPQQDTGWGAPAPTPDVQAQDTAWG